MNRIAALGCCLLVAGSCALAQQPPNPTASTPSSGNQASKNQSSTSQSSAPKDSAAQPASGQKNSDHNGDSNTDDQESSSRDTRIDTSAPKDDAKNHPNSQGVVSDLEAPPHSDSDVQEFHPWNPYKANKDIQVGDFYFKRRNYKGALDRYKEALYYKENDATATFRAGEAAEKLGNKAEARKYFELYLRILPEGPQAKEAHASLAKLEKSQ